MMVNNLQKIISHAMAFIEDDFTELWVIACKVQEENPEFEFEELIQATKIVVKELVIGKKILVLNPETKVPMNLSLWEILKLVDEKFKSLGRIPNIGDGIWFTV